MTTKKINISCKVENFLIPLGSFVCLNASPFWPPLAAPLLANGLFAFHLPTSLHRGHATPTPPPVPIPPLAFSSKSQRRIGFECKCPDDGKRQDGKQFAWLLFLFFYFLFFVIVSVVVVVDIVVGSVAKDDKDKSGEKVRGAGQKKVQRRHLSPPIVFQLV